MPDIDCHSEMTAFHREEVTLSKSQQDVMRKRRNAGRTRLESGLTEAKYPLPRERASQGSYRMRTMVQDDDNDYDIDDGVYFDQAELLDRDGNFLSPLAARNRICDALKWDGRLKYEAEVKRNCVRQAYPEGYHIDVPVYRIVTRDDEVWCELASGDQWIKSDARAVTRWFNGFVGSLNAGESDGSQMRRVTKLTKKFARRNDRWKAKTTSGINITKLVVDNFQHVPDRDDKALFETWKTIRQKLEKSTKIAHPVLVGSNLAEEGDDEVAFFRECLASALRSLEVLDSADCTLAQARQAWDSVFDTTFFSDQPEPAGSKGSSGGNSIAVTSVETARRNDGGGRFG